MKVKAKIVSALACGLKVLEDDFEELEIVKQEGGMIKAHHFSLFYFLPSSLSSLSLFLSLSLRGFRG